AHGPRKGFNPPPAVFTSASIPRPDRGPRADERARALFQEWRSLMAEQTPESGSGSLSLPEQPNLEWLKKEAKRRLDQLRLRNPDAKLTEAQFDLAKRYGFSSWR